MEIKAILEDLGSESSNQVARANNLILSDTLLLSNSRFCLKAAKINDRAGREKEALILYQKVSLKLDELTKEERADFYICYSSTMRNLHMKNEAMLLLENGAKEFPDNPAMHFFLSLCHADGNEFEKAYHAILRVFTMLPETKEQFPFIRSAEQYAEEYLEGK